MLHLKEPSLMIFVSGVNLIFKLIVKLLGCLIDLSFVINDLALDISSQLIYLFLNRAFDIQ